MVPYVDAVVAATVMRVLLFVLHVCLLKECDSVRLTAMLVWGMDEGRRWWRGGEWMRGLGLGLGFTNPVGTGEVLDVCLCFGCGGVGGVGGEYIGGLEGWCYVCVRCESGLSV